MRPFIVVEGQVDLQRPLELTTLREVSPAEGHTPMRVEDRSLKTFDETMGPRVPGFRARMADLQVLTDGIKLTPKLATPIGEDSLKRPSCGFVEGQEDVHKETSGVLSGIGGDDACRGIRAGRITGCDLPDLTHPFESTDVKGVQTDKLTRLLGFHVPPLTTGTCQLPSCTLCEQACPPGTVWFQDHESLLSGAQPHAWQRSIDGTGRQISVVVANKLQRVETRPAGGVRQSHGQNRLLILHRQTGRTSPTSPLASRVQSIPTVAFKSILPAVKERAGNAQRTAGFRDIAERFSPL
jgi:hypothetical protein